MMPGRIRDDVVNTMAYQREPYCSNLGIHEPKSRLNRYGAMPKNGGIPRAIATIHPANSAASTYRRNLLCIKLRKNRRLVMI